MLKDTKTSFGWISIGLHWANAIAVLLLLYFGVKIAYFHYLTPAPPPQFRSWAEWHMAIGVLITPFLIARVVWRLRSGKPKTHDQHPLLRKAADAVWRLLLIGIVLQLLTGPLWQWYRGHGLPVFHYFEVPTPFPLGEAPPPPPPASPEAARLAAVPPEYRHPEAIRQHGSWINKSLEYSHLWVGLLMGGLLVLHIGGALKHLIVDRDKVLPRMLWPPKGPAPAPEPDPSPGPDLPATAPLDVI